MSRNLPHRLPDMNKEVCLSGVADAKKQPCGLSRRRSFACRRSILQSGLRARAIAIQERDGGQLYPPSLYQSGDDNENQDRVCK